MLYGDKELYMQKTICFKHLYELLYMCVCDPECRLLCCAPATGAASEKVFGVLFSEHYFLSGRYIRPGKSAGLGFELEHFFSVLPIKPAFVLTQGRQIQRLVRHTRSRLV